MNPPDFHQATIEELGDGRIRIKGNAQDLNIILYIIITFGIIGAIFIGLQASDNPTSSIGLGLMTFVFFSIFGLFIRFLFIPFLLILLRSGNYYKLWWNDFTFNGKTVISGKFSIDVSKIGFIEPFVMKNPESDDWYYAQILNSNGIEIGRVHVIRDDLSAMVKYLSDLFGTPYNEKTMDKFWSNN